MFNLLRRKIQKDPICGMTANENFISKYGERFCSENCLKTYEAHRQNSKEEALHSHDADCGCCG